jgi:hypothetical protein
MTINKKLATAHTQWCLIKASNDSMMLKLLQIEKQAFYNEKN